MAVGFRSTPVHATRRRRAPTAVQEPLFDVELRPERRYFRQILQALSGVLLDADPLRAETAVSRVLGVVWASDPIRDGGAEEAFGLGLVDYARQQHRPTAVAMLRVLAGIGTLREVRDAATEAIRHHGVAAPDWEPAVGAVTFGRCWVAEDGFADFATVLCEFGYGPHLRTAPRHGLAVQIDQVNFATAVDAALVDDVDGTVHDLRFGAEHANDDFRLVEPGWAGAVLGRAFARTDLIPSTMVAAGYAGTRALALARVRTLPADADALPQHPEPTPQRCAEVVAEFQRSPEATGLAAPERVAELIVDFAASRDPGELTRVSPARWEAFLASPSTHVRDDEFADVVRAWSAWASRQSGMPMLARDELATLLDEMLWHRTRPDG